MRINKQNQHFYEFSEFRLDLEGRALWRGDELVLLPPKVLELLCLLVAKQGDIISKQELMNAVWSDAFVEESNLTQNIYTLRRLIGQQLIETVPRRGYRFAVPVSEIETDRTHYLDRNHNGLIETTNAPSKIADEQIKKVGNAKKPYLQLSISAVLVLLIGFIGAKIFQPQFTRSSQGLVEKVSFQKLTFSGDVLSPVISPDGKSLVYAKENNLYLQDVASGKSIQLNISGARVFGFLQFSPDGNSIYFRNQESYVLAGDVFQVSRFGGEPKLAFENVWSGFSLSPDGKKAAFVRFYPSQNEHSLVIKNLMTGEEQSLLKRKPPDSFFPDAYPAWTADGRQLAVVIRSPQNHVWQIAICDSETGKVQILETPRLINIGQVAWLPDNRHLIVSARENQKFFQLWQVSFPSGELNRLTNDLNIYRGISLSADGRNLLASQYTNVSHIWTASAKNLETPTQITFGNQTRDGINGITWTPDGDVIYASLNLGDLDLYLLRPEDGIKQRLTENAGPANLNPFITSDGRYIFFNSNRSSGSHIWRTNSTGENPVQITFSETENEFFPAVSPDGSQLYYVQRSPKFSAVWRKSLIDGKTESLTQQGQVAPNNFLSLSPDGKFLAFHNLTEKTEYETGKQIFQIGIIPTAELEEPIFFNIAASRGAVRWTNDSSAFDYIENTASGAKIWRQTLDETKPPQLIFNLPKDQIFNFAWSRDGENLAMARGQVENDAVLLTNFAH